MLLLGGTSDIGLAIVRELLGPSTRTVVLACRDVQAGERAAAGLCRDDLEVTVVPFEATATDEHSTLVAEIVEQLGELDVVIVAFGLLGEPARSSLDPADAARVVQINFAGAVSCCLAAVEHLRRQGHGHLVVLSSVAAERVRKANFVYGASKAGLDGFAQGLADALHGSGVSVLIVRPGWVRSAMTVGRRPAPLATTPQAVARRVVRAMSSGRRVVWAPAVLRHVFVVLRHLPNGIWRRLPQP